MPRRVCAEAGCPNPVTGRGRCDLHRKAKERDRARIRRAENRERNRLYARKRWRMTRKHKLFLNPLCELEHQGCLGLANEVHHRVAIEDGGDHYALDNLVSACKPCHSRETLREQRERGGTGVGRVRAA
jgi:5-methylcytosine-specific restriction enzyme A